MYFLYLYFLLLKKKDFKEEKIPEFVQVPIDGNWELENKKVVLKVTKEEKNPSRAKFWSDSTFFDYYEEDKIENLKNELNKLKECKNVSYVKKELPLFINKMFKSGLVKFDTKDSIVKKLVSFFSFNFISQTNYFLFY